MTRVRVPLAPVLGGLAVALVLGLTAVRTPDGALGAWQLAELQLLDTWFVARGPQPSTAPLTLVEVDDEALAYDPSLIERREGLARLIRRLWELEARAVALDFLLTDPEELVPGDLATDLRTWVASPEPDTPPRATELLQRTEALTHGDDVLEAALRDGETLLGFFVGAQRGVPVEDLRLARGAYGQVVPGDALPDSYPRALTSLPRFAKASKRLGLISAEEDRSGQIRSVRVTRRSGQRFFIPLGVQMAASHLGIGRAKMVFLGDEGNATLDGEPLPSQDGRIWLNWRGRGQIQTLSAAEVLQGSPDLAGRTVMVGYSGLGHDLMRTPFGLEPAMVTHATLMENVLQGDPLRVASRMQELLLVAFCGGLVLIGFVAPWRGLRLVGSVSGIVAAALVPPVLFVGSTFWMPAVGALLASTLTSLLAFAAAWVQEGSEARALRRAFAHYVSDDLLREMVRDPSLVQLRGQRRELSILFSDIRSFTTYSERIEPLDLIGFLNHYLTPMTRAVMRNRGFVDKYIGDAVMALFGAPVPQEDHAALACRSALDMFEALDLVRPEAQRHGIDLAIGVGINSGVVAVGNMGSEERLEYTVLGDAVNLASRLEGLTKAYGVYCLLGERTVTALPDRFRVRRLDLVRVKGKEEPVEIFELCGDDRTTVVTRAEPKTWDEALAAWRRGELERARASFERYRVANPSDRVVALYLERLAELGDVAPEGWDGVFTHRSK